MPVLNQMLSKKQVRRYQYFDQLCSQVGQKDLNLEEMLKSDLT